MTRRLWMNVSQEALSAVDDLRENRFIHGLKLSTQVRVCFWRSRVDCALLSLHVAVFVLRTLLGCP